MKSSSDQKLTLNKFLHNERGYKMSDFFNKKRGGREKGTTVMFDIHTFVCIRHFMISGGMK